MLPRLFRRALPFDIACRDSNPSGSSVFGRASARPEQIAKKITSKTKAILPVHLYGQPARMPEINQLAKDHKLFVIEDSAQAHGAQIAGLPIGFHSDAATFSFYPGKNLGAFGDAGAVVSQHEEIIEKVKRLRDHGRAAKNSFPTLGHCHRMDGMQGAILSAKLPFLGKWTEARQACAKRYREALKHLDQILLPSHFAKAQSVIHLFVIRTPKRDPLKEYLAREGIPSMVHYPTGLHLQKCFGYLNHKEGDFPNTEQVSKEVLSIPCYPELKESDQSRICEAIEKFVAS